MTLYSWYITSKQGRTLNRLPDKTSHITGMWPIAKARHVTELIHQEFACSKSSKSDLSTTKI